MATALFKECYVVEMKDVETGEIVTFHDTYLSYFDAIRFVNQCKAMDIRYDLSKFRTYKVKKIHRSFII